MNCRARFSRSSPISIGAAKSWVIPVLRLMLVLLFAFDQVSAPLHHHRHDAGMDGFALHTAVEVDSPLAQHFGPADDPAGGHAVTALKSEPRGSSILDADALLIAATPALFVALASLGEALTVAWRADIRNPVLAHRSLPPDGRAPPLHV